VLDLFEDDHLCVLGKIGALDHLRPNQGLSSTGAVIMGNARRYEI
jgi:hypothetical protein